MVFRASHKWIRTYMETRTSHDIISKWIQFALAIERLSRRLSFLRRKICAKTSTYIISKTLEQAPRKFTDSEILYFDMSTRNSTTFIECRFQLSLTSLNLSNFSYFCTSLEGIEIFLFFSKSFLNHREIARNWSCALEVTNKTEVYFRAIKEKRRKSFWEFVSCSKSFLVSFNERKIVEVYSIESQALVDYINRSSDFVISIKKVCFLDRKSSLKHDSGLPTRTATGMLIASFGF